MAGARGLWGLNFAFDPQGRKKKRGGGSKSTRAKSRGGQGGRKTQPQRRVNHCTMCERQMATEARRLQRAQSKRESELLARVRKETRSTGQVTGTTPTGLTERAVVMPQQFRSRGFSSFGLGGQPYFGAGGAARDPQRRRKRGRSRSNSVGRGRNMRDFLLDAMKGAKRASRGGRSGGQSLARFEARDPTWRNERIRHARASVLGHMRKGNKPSDKFMGRRPPLFTPVNRPRRPAYRSPNERGYVPKGRDFALALDAMMRGGGARGGSRGGRGTRGGSSLARFEERDPTWRNERIRHARAAVLGHMRKGNRPSDKFMGRRPPLFTPVNRRRRPAYRSPNERGYVPKGRDFALALDAMMRGGSARGGSRGKSRGGSRGSHMALDPRRRTRRSGNGGRRKYGFDLDAALNQLMSGNARSGSRGRSSGRSRGGFGGARDFAFLLDPQRRRSRSKSRSSGSRGRKRSGSRARDSYALDLRGRGKRRDAPFFSLDPQRGGSRSRSAGRGRSSHTSGFALDFALDPQRRRSPAKRRDPLAMALDFAFDPQRRGGGRRDFGLDYLGL